MVMCYTPLMCCLKVRGRTYTLTLQDFTNVTTSRISRQLILRNMKSEYYTQFVFKHQVLQLPPDLD